MKKNISLALIFTIMVSIMFTSSVKAEKFSDMPENWSKVPIEKAISNGLLQGNNGKINAQGNLTRAELVTILNRALGMEKKADLSNFKDVDSSKWYYNELAKGVEAKLLQGSNGSLNPNADISRQETFVIVARALAISDDTNEQLGFKDGKIVADWASKEISGLIKNGYLKGNDGEINPKGNISRAEFASLMNEIVGEYVTKAGLYEKNIKGNLLINSPNVELKSIKIDGDLILAEGVNLDKIVLNGVEVTGRVLVRAGGELVLENGSKVNDVLVSNNLGKTKINVDKTSQINKVDLKTKADISGEGKVLVVYVGEAAKDSEITTKDTKIDNSKQIEDKKPEIKSDDKKDKGSSGGGGGGGSSSSGGNTGNNDNDKETPTPKPEEKEKITVKPDANGNAVVRGTHLKEVILDGEFNKVTIDAPNASVIVSKKSSANEFTIKSLGESVKLNGTVGSFDIESKNDVNVILEESRKTSFQLNFKSSNSGKVNVRFGNNKLMSFSENIILKIDGDSIGFEDIKDDAVGVIVIEVRDVDTGELIEDIDIDLKNENGEIIKPVHSNYLFRSIPGDYSYAINIPVEGISPSGYFTVRENESVSIIIEIRRKKQPEITDKDRIIDDITSGLDIINKILDINESLIIGGNK